MKKIKKMKKKITNSPCELTDQEPVHNNTTLGPAKSPDGMAFIHAIYAWC